MLPRTISTDLTQLTKLSYKTKRSHSSESDTQTSNSEHTSSTSGRFSFVSSNNTAITDYSPKNSSDVSRESNKHTSFECDDLIGLTVNTTNTEKHLHRYNQKSWNTQADMDELMNILNDSLSQWENVYNLFIRVKAQPVKRAVKELFTYKSTLLTSSCKNEYFSTLRSTAAATSRMHNYVSIILYERETGGWR